MRNGEIIERCVGKLNMTMEDAKWVADHLYEAFNPDWSEMDWDEIDEMFIDTLVMKEVGW